VPKVQDLPTPQERREATEPARLASRFRYAQDRVRKIVDAAPPLTAEQRSRLAVILLAPGSGDAA
jgi:hypothetical protein